MDLAHMFREMTVAGYIVIVVMGLMSIYSLWVMVERFITALKAAHFDARPSGYLVAITGVVSPMAGDALTARGIKFAEKQLPNPLK